MTQNGSTRDSAIEALEARVAARLEAERGGGAGGATKPGATPASTRDDGENPSAPAGRGRRIDPKGVRDEWAEIAEWHSREGERLEVEAMSRKRAGQKAMAAALAAQTEAKAAARRISKTRSAPTSTSPCPSVSGGTTRRRRSRNPKPAARERADAERARAERGARSWISRSRSARSGSDLTANARRRRADAKSLRASRLRRSERRRPPCLTRAPGASRTSPSSRRRCGTTEPGRRCSPRRRRSAR